MPSWWDILTNGADALLNLTNLDAAGNITGEINDGSAIKPISGLFDYNAQ